jgi:hypothetical protein
MTCIAWWTTLAATVFDIYSNWYGIYLRSMNRVLESTRYGVMAYAVRLTLTASMLLAGMGLISFPAATLVSSGILRWFTRRECLRLLGNHPRERVADFAAYMKLLWPNSWKVGLQVMSSYFIRSANTHVCSLLLGLHATATYGLSLQLIEVAVQMSMVWITVKWPAIGICRAKHDSEGVRRILWPRLWAQNLTFIFLATGVLLFAPWLVHQFPGKSVLPAAWLGLCVLNSFLEMQFTVWGTLILTENRIPFLWPAVISNLASFSISITLILSTDLGLGALVLGPLISGCAFNYWFWPFYASRRLQVPLLGFLLGGKRHF